MSNIRKIKAEMRAMLESAEKDGRAFTDEEQKRFEELRRMKAQAKTLRELDQEKEECEEEEKEETPVETTEEPKDEEPKAEGEEQKPEEGEEQKPAEEEPKDEEPKAEETPAEEPKEEEKSEDEAIEKEEIDEDEETKRSRQTSNVETRSKNSQKMKKNFSLISAINQVIARRGLSDEVAEMNKRGIAQLQSAGKNAVGDIVIPSYRGISAGTNGTDAIAEDTLDILAPLYTNSAFVGLGATMLSGLVGDVKIPVLGAGAATWEGETDAAADAGQTTKHIKLTPHRLSCYVDISKQFLLQDSCGANAMLAADLVKAVQNKLESTGLGSQAIDDAPKGLFNGINAEAADLTYANIVDIIAAMEEANVYNGTWLLAPSTKAALSKVGVKSAQDTASLGFVFQNGEILGSKAVVSGNVVSKGLAYGDFSDLVVAQWGGLDITVDDKSQAINGNVRLVVNAYFDMQWRRQTSTTSEGVTTVTLDSVSRKILH